MRKCFVFLMMALITSAAMSGCCGRKCLEPTAAPITGQKWLDPSKIKEMKTHRGEFIQDAIQAPLQAAGQDPLNILILSGGGQNGAFGAGFLSGLAQRGDSTDLNFDIVTGISTGALQATYAFLGPEYYPRLEAAFSNKSQSDIFVHRFILSLLWSDSIVNPAPLRAFIENEITLDILNEVALAHESGRRLFIGTVDLDSSRLVVWNMGEIAQGRNQQALEKYHDILMAAGAIPVILPPVEIEYTNSAGELYKGLHVDGGLREVLFLPHYLLERQDSLPVKDRLTIIINGKIGLGYGCIKDHWIPIAKRTVSTSLDETTANGVLKAYLIACYKEMEFRLMRIPDDVQIDPLDISIDTAKMQMLIDKGKELAQSVPIPYEKNPPFAEGFYEICNQLRNR